MEKKKINIPPVAFIIAGIVGIIICLIIFLNLNNSPYKDEMFKDGFDRCEAVCTGKNITSAAGTETYLIDITFDVKQKGTDATYNVRLTETDPSLAYIDQGTAFEIYYKTDNPNYCHPVQIYPDYTAAYIVLAVIVLLLSALIIHNTVILIRNKDGYVPKFEKPDEIGYMGEVGTDSGLSDEHIDYAAGDVFSDHLMDSYVDPFAVYTGYDDNSESQPENDNRNYYDPNAGYEQAQNYQPEQAYPNMSQEDLNNPFATNINTDPDNPYNAGAYETPASMFDPDNQYNSSEIYGDNSYGSQEDYNSVGIYGDNSFGKAKT